MYSNFNKWLQSIAFFFILFSNNLLAEIAVSSLEVNLDNDVESLTLFNKGDNNAYIMIDELSYYEHPATIDERKLPLITTGNEKPNIIVSPRKLIIPPQSERDIRIINPNGKNDIEQIYSFRVLPLSKPFSAKTDQLAGQVTLAYGINVRIPAKKPRVKLAGKQTDKSIILSNNGTARAVVDSLKYCSQKKCRPIPVDYLAIYPNEHIELPLKNKYKTDHLAITLKIPNIKEINITI